MKKIKRFLLIGMLVLSVLSTSLSTPPKTPPVQAPSSSVYNQSSS